VIGEQIPDVIVPEDKRDESRALVEQMRTAERVEAELTRETTTGYRDFLFRNITVDAPTAGPDGYALYIDITERKEHERTLQRQNERLDEFASVVSHDLRNPMEVIKNRIQVTQQTGDESYLDQALDAVDRMDELLRDLRQLAQQGEQIGRPEPVDLEAVAETAWEHVATGDATLVVETDATVEADRGRLTQLLENLYINAVDHSTANGGTDNDAPANPTESTDDTSVEIRVGTDDTRCLYVEDDGPGIPPERRDEVFQSGYTTGTDGTGYGLTIVRQVAQAHEWDVGVTAGSDGGARFEFRGLEFVDD
jgi:signal transduction histidine kinase